METHTRNSLYTIGHSNHPWRAFAALLQSARILAIADVRTYPRSRFAHFNQAVFRARLSELGIAYHYFGDTLGGRPNSTPEQPDLIANDASFGADAVTAVARLAADRRTALLCSEHEPLDCHRFTILAQKFEECGIEVNHILRDGSIERNAATEARALRPRRKSPQNSLKAFRPPNGSTRRQ